MKKQLVFKLDIFDPRFLLLNFLHFQRSYGYKITFIKLFFSVANGREKFSTRAFAKKYCLEGPMYGNFFQAEYDDFVPILYQQFTN